MRTDVSVEEGGVVIKLNIAPTPTARFLSFHLLHHAPARLEVAWRGLDRRG
jgi:hypothetical protein